MIKIKNKKGFTNLQYKSIHNKDVKKYTVVFNNSKTTLSILTTYFLNTPNIKSLF